MVSNGEDNSLGNDHQSHVTYLVNDHQTFRQRLNNLRKYDQLVDVCLKVTGSEKVFNAHRVILAASSDYFTTSMPLIITVKGVTEKDLQDILAYIYLGEVVVPQERLHSFQEAAKILKIHKLQDTHIEETVDQQEEQVRPNKCANQEQDVAMEIQVENMKLEPGLDLDWSSNNNIDTPPSNLTEIEQNQPQILKIPKLQDTPIGENAEEEDDWRQLERQLETIGENVEEKEDDSHLFEVSTQEQTVDLTLEVKVETMKNEPGLDCFSNNVLTPPANLEEYEHIIKNQPKVVLQREKLLKVKSKSKEQVENFVEDGSRTPHPNTPKSSNKRFSKSKKLKRQKGTHKDDRPRPHQCQYCSQKFFSPSHVKTHELIHLGIRPFKCQFCHKPFRTMGNIKRHEVKRCPKNPKSEAVKKKNQARDL